jgi:hypothetical protein
MKKKRKPMTDMELLQMSPALAMAKKLLVNSTLPVPIPKVKRRPLLYDEFMACTKPQLEVERKPFEFLRNRMVGAHVFTLDHDAARYMANMMQAHPEAIALDQEFAIPPFKQMFVEFPYPEFFAIMGGHHRGDGSEDERIGYFYDGPRVYVLSASTDTHRYPSCVPIRYRLNQQFELSEERIITDALEESRIALDAYFWGSCAPKVNNLGLLRSLRAHHSMEFWFGQELFAQGKTKFISRVMASTAGDLRNVVALPLFLNRVREVIYEEQVPGVPGFVRAKPRTLVRHSVVKIKLDPAPLLKKIYSGSAGAIWRREHDVRGHWCHDKTWRAHPHDHEPTEYDVNQWRCLLCGGLKWWRKEHRRGKREMGKVKTTYEVHA